jgi:Kef-type K+ transport system membrane component KefB
MNPEHFAILLLELVLIIGLSLVGRASATALEQPAVLGEMLAGMVCANLVHLAGGSFGGVVHDLNVFGEFGVILLLFSVGLETNLTDLLKVGPQALKVAAVGVIAPLLLGLICGHWLIANATFATSLFIGAALTATSVGITSRVFKDLKRLGSSEAQLVLGAAIVDDVLGLILLAVVSGIASQGEFALLPMAKVALVAALFLGVIIWFGETVMAAVVPNLEFLEPPNRRLLVPLALCFFLAWLANQIGLASIVGAFAAGVMLKDRFFAQSGPTLLGELAPLESLFAPVFFVLIGLQVDLSTLLHGWVFVLAVSLSLAAVVGKLACALVVDKKLDGLMVGAGMIPRGEVGLIFAGIGRTLEVIDDEVFAAIVLMVVFTTLITPPALKWVLEREDMPEVRVKK